MIPTPWRPPHLTAPREVTLPDRQAAVLFGLVWGLSSREIAARMFLSDDTIRSHTKGLYRAMRARNRAHAASLAMSGQVDIFVRDQS